MLEPRQSDVEETYNACSVPVEVFLLLLSIVGFLQAELNRCLQLVFRKSYEDSLLPVTAVTIRFEKNTHPSYWN